MSYLDYVKENFTCIDDNEKYPENVLDFINNIDFDKFKDFIANTNFYSTNLDKILLYASLYQGSKTKHMVITSDGKGTVFYIFSDYEEEE